MPAEPAPGLPAYRGQLRHGTGKATAAFKANNEARMDEVRAILGFKPFPGTLNVQLDRDFDRTQPKLVGELPSRRKRPATAWFWRVLLDGHVGWVFCFPDAKKDWSQINVVAPYRLREFLADDVEITHA